jgi:phage I-like protein
MVLKIPPPPRLSRDFQSLNRWLIEIQSILNSQGTIDPSSVDGLPALFTQVAGLATQVAALAITVAANTANITTNTTNITANTASIATLNTEVTALTARNQILNGSGVPGAGLGNNGDLYINDTGGVGTFLYGKIAGAWVAFA